MHKVIIKYIVIGVLAATALTSPVRAEAVVPLTVQQFFEVCQPTRVTDFVDDNDYIQFGLCMGVIVGLSSLMDLNCQLGRNDTPNHLKANLSGGNTSLTAYRQTMWNYANDNPSLRSFPVGMLAASLAEEWPCIEPL